MDASGDPDGPEAMLLGGSLVSVEPSTLPPFGTPTVVTELSAVAAEEDDPCLTRDMLEIFFDSGRIGGNRLYTSRRASVTAPWSAPVRVTELDSGTAEEHPQISGSGLTLYFTSARGGSPDVWVTTRATRDAVWTTPVVLDVLNSPEVEEMGGMDALETVLVLASRRGGMMTDDLFESRRPSGTGPWSDPTSISELNSPTYDRSAHIDDRGLVMYLENSGEIHWSSRTQLGAPWTAPVELVELSTSASESDPWLSPDLRTIYFVRDTGPGTKDIYMATR